MGDRLPPDLVERVLARLGLDRHPDATADGLHAVYRAWGRTIPFDNLIKRAHLATGDPGQIPNASPEQLFELHLRHGTGGTCWPTSVALHALLVSLGFDARLGSAAMRELAGGPNHNHGTVLVRIDGGDWWTDTSMLSEVPLPLDRERATELRDPVNPMRAEPADERWRVWWQQPSSREALDCLLLADDVTPEHCHTRYEASRGASPFNASTYVTRNVEGGKVTFERGQRFEKTADGIASLEVDDRRRFLVDELGFSEEIVDRQPPDEA